MGKNKNKQKELVNDLDIKNIGQIEAKSVESTVDNSIEKDNKIKELEIKLNSVSTNTNVLQETLLIAKQTADEMKKRAEEEASIIVGEAKKMLEDRAGNIDQIIEEKQNTLNFLKNEIETYKAKAERMLIEQLEILKKIEEQQQNQ